MHLLHDVHPLTGPALTFRHLQANADASLLSGNGNPTAVRQAILGFNSGRN